jgi:hypothetical protein
MASPEQRVRHFEQELERLKGRLLEMGVKPRGGCGVTPSGSSSAAS